MNKQWHENHKLASDASMDERITWHLKHAANCGCRPIPATVMRELEERGFVVPSQASLK